MHWVDMPSHPKMPISRDVRVDACSIQLASIASVVLAFVGLMYKILILRWDIAFVVAAFMASIIIHLVRPMLALYMQGST